MFGMEVCNHFPVKFEGEKYLHRKVILRKESKELICKLFTTKYKLRIYLKYVK